MRLYHIGDPPIGNRSRALLHPVALQLVRLGKATAMRCGVLIPISKRCTSNSLLNSALRLTSTFREASGLFVCAGYKCCAYSVLQAAVRFVSCRYQALNVSTNDFADIRRCLLQNYLQAALSHEAAADAVALRAFLRSAQRADWPDAVGPIDLTLHDRPHDSSATEWWYFNTHFEVR